MQRAMGRASSSETFPATGVMHSIFNSGERIASNSARASSTPGSVSMMTRDGARAGWLDSPKANALGVKLLAIKALVEDVTNSRRVNVKAFFLDFMSG